ncbi:unnamed protein product [Urochloa humidicola]
MDGGEDGVSSPLQRSISTGPIVDHLHDSAGTPFLTGASSSYPRDPLSLLIARTRAARGWDATVPADPGGSRPSELESTAPGNGTFLTGGDDQTLPPFCLLFTATGCGDRALPRAAPSIDRLTAGQVGIEGSLGQSINKIQIQVLVRFLWSH